MQKKQLYAKQEAKLNSYRATEMHVDGNIAIISGILAFQATYTKIKANIVAIIDAETLKSASLSGIAVGKSNFRQALCKSAAIIAGLVYTYAADTSNTQMLAEMNLSYSTINRTRDDELAPLCQFIHDRANANLDALKDYNVTAAKLDQLQTLITNFSAETPKPRTAISERKTTNANIVTIFKETDKLFAQFDKQIESLTEENPDFVQTYFSTREIVDPPKMTTQLKGKITAENNGQPVRGALVQIVEISISVGANSLGEYLIKPISPSKYTIRVTAVGFQDFEQDEFEIKMGVINNLNIKMQSSSN